MNKQIIKYFAWLLTIGVLLTSACKKINDTPSSPHTDPGTGIVESGQANVKGMVVNSAGAPLPCVQVIVNNGSAVYSDNNGAFSVDNAAFSDGRIFVLCKKDGYFNGSKGAIARDGSVTTVKITMGAKQDVSTFASSAGVNNVTNDGVHIDISADGIVTAAASYNGTVKMATRYINPASTTLSDQMPGGDFRAINNQHKDVQLYSYGAIEVELKSASGENLQLKPGTVATLTIPIAAGQQATAPQSIPLWYFDEAKGKWIEDGSAQKQGNQYVGKVKHFTPWNLDVEGDWAIVEGHVTSSCDGSPLGGTTVHIGQSSAIADDKGFYEMYVPAGQALTGNVTIFADNSVTSGDINIAPVNANKTKAVDIQTGCGAVTLTGQLVQAGDKPIWGTVAIKTPKGNFTAITGQDGKFSQPVPASAVITITGYANDGEQSAEITVNTPAAGSKDVGKLLVTSEKQKIGRITFTLNGGGFNNKTMEITSPYSPTMPEAYYVSASDETGIAKAVNGYSIVIAFPGKSIGKPTHVTIFLAMAAEKRTLTADSGDGELTLNVTKYGPVGDVLEGTFSGRFKQVNPATGELYGDVTISNGAFKVYRGPNQ